MDEGRSRKRELKDVTEEPVKGDLSRDVPEDHWKSMSMHFTVCVLLFYFKKEDREKVEE
jgi:hypothetical protein